MPLMEWDDDRFATGVAEMDEQHQNLFSLVNDLHEAMSEGKADDEVGRILGELQEYAEYHFADEEGFMKDCGYSHDCSECFFDHKGAHREFEAEVNELVEQHEAGQPVTFDTMNFIKNWLTGHIAGTNQDQDYGEYYNSAN